MKRRLTILALTTLAVVALIGVVLTINAPAQADGATQIRGTGVYAEDGECTDPEGQESDAALVFDGDLKGCFYVFIDFENSQCINTGNGQSIYHERGTNIFAGKYDGKGGTFDMTYLFTSKWSGPCDGDGIFPTGDEIFGRCQHPIIRDSGTGKFEGVTGRLDLRDVIDENGFSIEYKGHLK